MTPDPLAAWWRVLHPDGPALAIPTPASLPTRPVYEDPPPDTLPSAQRLFHAEWSLRHHLSSAQVDRARVMLPVHTAQASPGSLGAWLRALAPQAPPALPRLADRLHRDRPDLDLLVGVDFGGDSPRAKLYVLRPAGRPVANFRALSVDLLKTAQVHPDWTQRQIDAADRDPAFLALDLRADGGAAGKLYFAHSDPDDAHRTLRRLGRDRLCSTLDTLSPALAHNPTGTLVVTPRGAGSDTRDVTLHAHLGQLPALSEPLAHAVHALAAQARERGWTLRPSFASWLDGPQPAQSAYYVIRPE